jgi:predicted ArsR family transcriptional regulator
MFLNVFHDLLKPQWLSVLMQLKISGGMAVSDLAKELGVSYMTVKQHCEDLTKHDYLMRIRLPRTEIGRPEIFYRLTEKADALFPAVPSSFSIQMLDHARTLFGDTAPEKLLYQYFQDQETYWKARLSQGTTLLYRAGLFVKLRSKEGLFMCCICDEVTERITLREFHHPLRAIFEKFPRAIAMEQRAMEEALGVKISRLPGEPVGGESPYMDFILS